MSRGHKKLEKNIILMSVFIVVAVSLGGLVEILPLIFQDQVRTPAEGVKPYPALQLAGVVRLAAAGRLAEQAR